ncbi:MAG: alpha/beta hydrolase [Gemmatimonadetes bacterium]|nr:alpha/beta hydrolase [Gemmatimonadota bacterium]
MKPSAIFLLTIGLGAGAFSSSQVEEGLLPINGTDLFVERMGSGEPIVVVRGGPVMEHGYLLTHLAPLAESHELIFFDQRLSGRSAATVDSGTVRLATFVEDIEALRVALDLGRIHLMAHSWGGLLAMRYAVEHGENLDSLILLNSMSASSALWQEEETILAQRATAADSAERQAVLESEGFAQQRPEAIAKLLRVSFKLQFHDRSFIDRLTLYVPDDYTDRSRQFEFMMVDLMDFNLHDALASVTTPTLIMDGSDEPDATLAGAALHQSLQYSTLVIIGNSGHLSIHRTA